jgi:hypothetical protein
VRLLTPAANGDAAKEARDEVAADALTAMCFDESCRRIVTGSLASPSLDVWNFSSGSKIASLTKAFPQHGGGSSGVGYGGTAPRGDAARARARRRRARAAAAAAASKPRTRLSSLPSVERLTATLDGTSAVDGDANPDADADTDGAGGGGGGGSATEDDDRGSQRQHGSDGDEGDEGAAMCHRILRQVDLISDAADARGGACVVRASPTTSSFPLCVPSLSARCRCLSLS